MAISLKTARATIGLFRRELMIDGFKMVGSQKASDDLLNIDRRLTEGKVSPDDALVEASNVYSSVAHNHVRTTIELIRENLSRYNLTSEVSALTDILTRLKSGELTDEEALGAAEKIKASTSSLHD